MKPNVYAVLDSNHGYKMIGVGREVAKALMGEHAPLLHPFRFERFATGAFTPSRTRPTPGPDPPVAPSRGRGEDGAVLIILLLGFAPWLILLTLVLALYLTVIELLELRPNYGWWIWWLLLVFLTHFVGYLILRGYAYYQHREAARP